MYSKCEVKYATSVEKIVRWNTSAEQTISALDALKYPDRRYIYSPNETPGNRIPNHLGNLLTQYKFAKLSYEIINVLL